MAGIQMDHQEACHEEGLASARVGNIPRCRCGIYHVRINATTLHLTAKQFDAAARFFKLALGMLAGHRLNDSPPELAVWESRRDRLRLNSGV